ncbi:MAG: transcriptional repressor LexA [Syntrophomonadaceae bacterium]
MYEDLSPRQEQILDYIKARIKSSGYPPSVREIGQAVGLKSSSTVHAHLVQLEEKGYLRKDAAKPRAIIPVPSMEEQSATQIVSLPLIGQVAAGVPILAEQNIDAFIPVPLELIGSGNHFILQVKGDSMIDAGIIDGDYLIVRQQADAHNGEIVVAVLEDEATVKRLFKHDGYVELRPENQAMEPIIVPHADIAGKVAGLLRRM